MKTITILGREFQYDTYFFRGDFGCGWITNFYDGTEKKKSDSWFWKGFTETPIFVFRVSINIESREYSKEELREILEKEYSNYLKIAKRKKEIMAGELV